MHWIQDIAIGPDAGNVLLSSCMPYKHSKMHACVNDKGNHRPISVISHIAKNIEREVKHQMCTYLEHNALIAVDQSAYIANAIIRKQRCIRCLMPGA